MTVDRHPPGDAVVLTPSVRSRRVADLKLTGLFVLMALPLAAIVGLIIGWGVAAVFVVVWTAFLSFGLRRRHLPVLRLDRSGISFEPGQFHLRCGWDNVVGTGLVDLPSGRVDALLLRESALHWAADSATRKQVRSRGWDKAVPVGDFEDDWRHGRAGDAVRRWAPGVLDAPPAAPPEPPDSAARDA